MNWLRRRYYKAIKSEWPTENSGVAEAGKDTPWDVAFREGKQAGLRQAMAAVRRGLRIRKPF